MPRAPFKFLPLLLAALAAVLLPATAQASQNLYLANGDAGGTGEALVFPIGADGLATSPAIQTVSDGGYLNAVSMSPDGKYLFMADYNENTVVSYSVGADGRLTSLPGSPKLLSAGSGPYGTAVTPDGKFLIVGEYDRGGIEALRLGADGSLTEVPGGFIELDPSASPYMVAVTPDSRFVYVPDQPNEVFAVAIGPDGALSELAGSPYPAGTNPYMAAVTPDGKYLYVPNTDSDDVSAYAIGADGALSELPGSPFEVITDQYGGIAVSPDGKTLYTSGAEQIEAATIAADGSLTVAAPPVVIGTYNPGLALSPDGKHLYNSTTSSNPGEDLLSTYSVGAGGALSLLGTPQALPATSSADIQSLIVTPEQPPQAALTSKAGKKANSVVLNASGSTDADGTITSYAWDFGNGKTATTTTPKVTHKYGKAGDFTATVTLTDDAGCSTAIIFTGQTAYCNGSSAAVASKEVDVGIKGAKVKVRTTQKQRGSLAVEIKASAKEKARAVASGSAKFAGVPGKVVLKKAKSNLKPGKPKTLVLKAKSKSKSRAVVGSKGKAKIQVKLTDRSGNKVKQKFSVKLK